MAKWNQGALVAQPGALCVPLVVLPHSLSYSRIHTATFQAQTIEVGQH